MRRTNALITVLAALMADPDGRHWGYEVSKQSGLRSGVLYPILHRMLDEGWLMDGWEETVTNDRKRPPRRYYEVTDEGRRQMGAMLAEARQDARFQASLSPRFA
jgi:PadR family transcriptional regulator PadR